MSVKEKDQIKVDESGQVNQAYVKTEEENPPPYSAEMAKKTTISSNPNFGNVNSDMRPISSMTPAEIRSERFAILKNVAVISISFMFLFSAFQSMANLQSSINDVAGLGTFSLSTLYAAIVVSCMFVPTWLIKTLKCKWTLVFCQLCYSCYIAAQFYPSFETLIPTAIILGLGAAPMWSAKCTYLTQVGNRYAELIGDTSPEPTIVRFFGFFFMVFQTSQIWGNLITSSVFSTGNKTEISEEQLEICGARYCNDKFNNTSAIQKPSIDKIYTAAGILLAFAIAASIINALFVDPLTRFGENSRQGSSTGKSGLQLLTATFRHMRNPYQLLIAPLTLWSGFEQAYLSADYTAGFISCSWGVENVGYVLICYGAVDAIGSFTCGAVVKKIGRIPIFLFAASVNLGLIIAMLVWRPTPDRPELYFIVAALWGLGDAVWQTQINAFYGVIFPANEEAAFSNYRLWESIGFIIAYIYSTYICVDAKLYVLLGVLIAGMTGYLIIEKKEFDREKKQAL